MRVLEKHANIQTLASGYGMNAGTNESDNACWMVMGKDREVVCERDLDRDVKKKKKN